MHSDNYIPANPMQTPASIIKQAELFSDYLLALSNAPLLSNMDLVTKTKGKNNNKSTKNVLAPQLILFFIFFFPNLK